VSALPSFAQAAPVPGTERDAQALRLRALLRGEEPAPPTGRLSRLVSTFGLAPFEADVLALLWTAAYEPALRQQLMGDEEGGCQVTVRLVARRLGHAARVRLSSESPLLLWRMVHEHPLVDGNAVLSIDPSLLAWMDGDGELDRVLVGHVQLLEPALELPSWPLAAAALRLRDALARGQRWRLRLRTDDAVSARWFAAALCRRLGLPVLAVHAGAYEGDAADIAAIHLHRMAFLDGGVPCFASGDAALSRPHAVVPYPLQIVHGQGSLQPAAPGVQDLDWPLDPPGFAERELLWRHALPSVASWPASDLTDLALCQEADAADILAAAAWEPANAAQAVAALRMHRRSDLAPLARRVEASFTWDDLVLPAEARRRLEDIVFEARERRRLWAEPEAARLFPYGRGLVALFAGPPGTGKTMAAQVIAADLGLDLMAVDLSAIVSKWVGETAQHLQQLLSSPAARRSVLFFDEADALYGKRVDEVRDAQDRFANLDTSYLMTALEGYPGIVLLASNLKANIDAAFLRRIRHVVDFAKPNAPARENLWLRSLVALFPSAQLAGLLPLLPRIARIEATGAAIKGAALSALFAARRDARTPDLRLLGEMLARELAKEGAGLSARELDDWLETPE
jgi:hypothetical protein